MKRIVASIWIGIAGACLGGFLGRVTAELTDSSQAAASMARLTLPAGAITGFLACALLSIWYLRIMSTRSWQSGVVIGLLFGALAGAGAGFITGIFRAAGESSHAVTSIWSFLFSGIFAAFIGGTFGLFAGFVISLIIGPLVIDSLKGSP